MRSRSLIAGALFALIAAPILAQAPAGTPTNIRGQVASLKGETLLVKSRDGRDVSLTLAPDFAVLGIVKAKLSDIKAGDFVGVAAIPGKDGRLHAQEVLLFPEAARGTGEGHYPWDLRGKGESMTNATVAQVERVSSGKSRLLHLKHKDGTVEIVVGPKTPIVTFAPDKKDLLQPGATIFIRAVKTPDGSLTAARVLVEKNGVKPPM
jgi:hypothetical protein